jgi:hypothetical protein
LACAVLSGSAESGAAWVTGAVPIYSHGNDFHAYNASEATLIDYVPSGVRTLSSNATAVVASVDHSISTNGMSIYVDGFHWSSQTTTCTAYTFDRNGALLTGNTSNTGNVSGSWTLFFAIQTSGNVADRYVTVLCTIPASGSGLVRGITTNVN